MFLACDISAFFYILYLYFLQSITLENIPLSSSVLHDTMINALTSINSLQKHKILQTRRGTVILDTSAIFK